MHTPPERADLVSLVLSRRIGLRRQEPQEAASSVVFGLATSDNKAQREAKPAKSLSQYHSKLVDPVSHPRSPADLLDYALA